MNGIFQLYKVLPSSLRNTLASTVVNQLRQLELKSEKEYQETHPKAELQAEHIKDLTMLTDKPALLDVLPKNSTAAEIGVFRGDYSEKILSRAQPQKLHLIDVWDEQTYEGHWSRVKTRFEDKINQGQVEMNRGYSTEELQKFDDKYFDWVYIDTNHSYETTAKELELCRHKVKSGGIIAGHDYVKGSWAPRVRYGVVEAVNEFCVKHNWGMVYLTIESHGNHSYALKELQ